MAVKIQTLETDVWVHISLAVNPWASYLTLLCVAVSSSVKLTRELPALEGGVKSERAHLF